MVDQTIIKEGIQISETLYDFASTNVGTFAFMVLGVVVISRNLVKSVVYEMTLWLRYNPKKEKIFTELSGIFSTLFLSFLSPAVWYWGKGPKKIIVMIFLLLTASMASHYFLDKYTKKKKNEKYGGK